MSVRTRDWRNFRSWVPEMPPYTRAGLIKISPFFLHRITGFRMIQPISIFKAMSQVPAPFLARPIIIRPSDPMITAVS